MIQTTQLSGGSLGTLVLGLAASLLALAVFVQVVQEIYKFLASGKSRADANALRDYLGPWSATILKDCSTTSRSGGHCSSVPARPAGGCCPSRPTA